MPFRAGGAWLAASLSVQAPTSSVKTCPASTILRQPGWRRHLLHRLHRRQPHGRRIFTGASGDDANFTNADLTNANFTNADLYADTFTGSTFTAVTWSNAECPGTRSNSNINGSSPDSCIRLGDLTSSADWPVSVWLSYVCGKTFNRTAHLGASKTTRVVCDVVEVTL